MDETTTYLARIWLDDRPGALGRVASRIGGLRGDVTGLEIVERWGGRAIDELVVELPSDVPVDLIARELADEDGVAVEEIREMDADSYDPQLDVLETAALLLASETPAELAQALCDHARRSVHLDWACVLDSSHRVLGDSGQTPPGVWISSYIGGSPAIRVDDHDEGRDTEWIALPESGGTFIVGRDVPIRGRERRRVIALAQIADRWSVTLRSSRMSATIARNASASAGVLTGIENSMRSTRP